MTHLISSKLAARAKLLCRELDISNDEDFDAAAEIENFLSMPKCRSIVDFLAVFA